MSKFAIIPDIKNPFLLTDATCSARHVWQQCYDTLTQYTLSAEEIDEIVKEFPAYQKANRWRLYNGHAFEVYEPKFSNCIADCTTLKVDLIQSGLTREEYMERMKANG